MLHSCVFATLVGAVHVGVGLCSFMEGLSPCYREMVCYSTPFKTTVLIRLRCKIWVFPGLFLDFVFLLFLVHCQIPVDKFFNV